MKPYLAAAINDQRAQHDARIRESEPSPEKPKPFPKWKKDELHAEIARRNSGRPTEDRIVVDGKGTVADLAAALEADDLALGGAAGEQEPPADPTGGQEPAAPADQPDNQQPKEN